MNHRVKDWLNSHHCEHKRWSSREKRDEWNVSCSRENDDMILKRYWRLGICQHIQSFYECKNLCMKVMYSVKTLKNVNKVFVSERIFDLWNQNFMIPTVHRFSSIFFFIFLQTFYIINFIVRDEYWKKKLSEIARNLKITRKIRLLWMESLYHCCCSLLHPQWPFIKQFIA